MGTRGAVGVRSEGQLYITYNHWDSYPSGLGTEMVAFCRRLTKETIATLKERFKHVKIVEQTGKATPEEQKKYIEAGFYDNGVSSQSSEEWYCLLRKLQGVGYLEAVLEGKCQHWIDDKEFLKDSLFCEYAYIIDLDKEDLLFFEGFNKKKDDNSPLPFPQVPEKDEDDDGYYPVRFKGKAALAKIPDDWESLFYPAKVEAE